MALLSAALSGFTGLFTTAGFRDFGTAVADAGFTPDAGSVGPEAPLASVDGLELSFCTAAAAGGEVGPDDLTGVEPPVAAFDCAAAVVVGFGCGKTPGASWR